MRRKSLLAGAIAIVGVLAVGVPVVGAAASTTATSSRATKITCTFKNYNQTPKQLSGFSFRVRQLPEAVRQRCAIEHLQRDRQRENRRGDEQGSVQELVRHRDHVRDV